MNEIFDEIADLSLRHQAIFLAGVRGADGDEPGGDPEPEEGALPDADATAEAEENADGDAEGDPEAEASIPDLPEDLTTADADALTDLYALYGDARTEVRDNAHSRADFESVQDLTQRREAIRAELQRRVDEDRSLQEDLAGLDEQFATESALPEPAVPVASAQPKRPTAAQIAQARGAQPDAGQNPTGVQRTPSPMLAAMSTDQFGTGAPVDLFQIGSMLDRVKRGSDGRAIVASLAPFEEGVVDDSQVLSDRHGAAVNTELMRESQEKWRFEQMGKGDSARMAAICEPLDIIRTIPDSFSTAEPVREIFPSRPAGRLGFTFMTSVDLSAVLSGVNYWTEADQDAVDPDNMATWKDCLDVACGTSQDITAEAITACLTYDITTEMSSPEHIQNLMNALMAVKARKKEAKILQRVDELSHPYFDDGSLGAMPSLIRAINAIMSQAVFDNRLNDPTYTVILPPGLVGLLMTDMAGRGFNSDTVTDVLGYLRDNTLGVRTVVQSLDASATGQPKLPFQALAPLATPRPIPGLDGTHRIRIVDPGGALYAETGEMNVGTTRDSQLLRQNKTQYFAEEFLMLAKNGPEPWFRLDLTLCGDGSRAGWWEPTGCAS